MFFFLFMPCVQNAFISIINKIPFFFPFPSRFIRDCKILFSQLQTMIVPFKE